ncbi:MAG: hypothetical protein ACPGN3_05095 [Opitutales bacterium]
MKIQNACLFLCALSAPFFLLAEEDEHDYHEEDNPTAIRAEISEFMEEEEGQYLKRFIQAHFSKEAVSMLQRRIQDDPFEAREWLFHIYEIKEEYDMLEEEEPAYAQLFLQFQKHEINAYIYSAKLEEAQEHDGSQAELEELQTKLKAEITTAFDLKLKMQTEELGHLKREVVELENLLERRKNSRSQIIERRFNALSGKDDHLEW